MNDASGGQGAIPRRTANAQKLFERLGWTVAQLERLLPASARTIHRIREGTIEVGHRVSQDAVALNRKLVEADKRGLLAEFKEELQTLLEAGGWVHFYTHLLGLMLDDIERGREENRNA